MNKFRIMSVFVVLAMLLMLFSFANVSPVAAAGPIVQFDAAALALQNGDLVTTWGGQVASGTPTFLTNQTPNGMPAVQFNGGGDRMGDNVAVPASAAGDWILVAVIKPQNIGAYHNLADDDPASRPMLWIDPNFNYELNYGGGTGAKAAGAGTDGWDIVIADSRLNQLYVNSPTPNATGGGAISYPATKNYDFFHRDGLQTFRGLVAEMRIYTDRAEFGGDFAALYSEMVSKYFGDAVAVTLQEGTATFSQNYPCCALPVDQAVDGIIIFGVGNIANLNGWGIHPAVGQNHTAVFETSTDISASQLDFKLYQLWGGAHNLGRFRLSYTTDDRSTFADGLNEGGDVTANWTVLTGATITSTGGETFTVLGDNSILVSGNNPDTTVYSVSFSGSFSGITGIRLEAHSDVSLPYGGPGRQGNGNFTITEITLDATPPLNQAPTANAGGPYLVAVGQQVAFDGSGSYDPDDDSLTESWSAYGGTVSGNVFTAGSVPGIYDVQLVVNDGTVDSLPATTMVVVYDPSGGFVTGGGWIDSPAGAYKADETLSGKASFGFVAKYKKGATVPDGNTQFQFKAGDLNFHSTSYEWLVVAGNTAQFKGEGTINGQGSYMFKIWADDDNPDTFRIMIWGDNGVVYDNGSQQSLGGGSIKVHQ